MLAQPAILLGSIPIDNPFPLTLVLSTAATAVFGAELVIAALRVHRRTWMYVFLAGCVILGAALMAWSGYYALHGPPAVDPLMYPTIIRNPWFDFYVQVKNATIETGLLTLILVLVLGIVLWRQKRS